MWNYALNCFILYKQGFNMSRLMQQAVSAKQSKSKAYKWAVLLVSVGAGSQKGLISFCYCFNNVLYFFLIMWG